MVLSLWPGCSHGPNYNYYHLDHNITTIKYYVSNVAKDDNSYTWDTEVTSAQAEEARNAYVNSLLEWSNKYYYTYDQSGNRIANRIINIEEETGPDQGTLCCS